MKKPTMTELTKVMLDNIAPYDIIYAEVAEGGAMGNVGGSILYLIEEDKLICYTTNMFENQDIYVQAESMLLKHQDRLKINGLEFQEKLFDYFYGGMGNHVFVNKNVTLDAKDGYFIYIKGNVEYQIFASALGVFNSVVQAMENSESN